MGSGGWRNPDARRADRPRSAKGHDAQPHPCPDCAHMIHQPHRDGAVFNHHDLPGLTHICPAKKEQPMTQTVETPCSAVDPFEDYPPLWPERNGRGQPLVIPAGGDKAIPYNRASSMSDYIENTGGLTAWKLQHLAVGLARREDLAAMIGALPALTGDRDTDRPTKAALNDLIAQAQDCGGMNAKANYGTAIHGYTEPAERLAAPHARMTADVASFTDTLAAHGITIVKTECFTVNDATRSAGTFDHLVLHPTYGLIVADKKTGTVHPHSLAIQLAVYADGDLYGEGHIRTPMPADLNRDVGLLIHIPKEAGATYLYAVDLVAGRAALQIATRARDYQAYKGILTPLAVEVAA